MGRKGLDHPVCNVQLLLAKPRIFDILGASGDNDGFDDLVVKIEDQDGTFTAGTGTATVTGNLLPEFGGTPFKGTNTICVTQ